MLLSIVGTKLHNIHANRTSFGELKLYDLSSTLKEMFLIVHYQFDMQAVVIILSHYY